VVQCVAVCCHGCRVLPCVAVCCRVLPCVAVCVMPIHTHAHSHTGAAIKIRCSVLQCVAVCCSVLQCVAVCVSCTYTHTQGLPSRVNTIWQIYPTHFARESHMRLVCTINGARNPRPACGVGSSRRVAMCHVWPTMCSAATGLFCHTCWPSLSASVPALEGEVGGWGRVPFSKNLMSPTPRRKWYFTTGRRAH